MGKKKEKDLKEIALRSPAKNAPISEIETLEKLDEAISKIGSSGRKILLLEIARDKEIALIKANCQQKINPLKAVANTFFEAIVRYALKHRDELLPPDRKSTDLTNGTIGWQFNPPSVKLTVDEEIAVTYLKERGHKECIRTKEYVDLEAIGKDPELARSLSIVEYNDGTEYFYAKPHGVQVNFTRRMKAIAEKALSAVKVKTSKKKT